VAHISGAEDLDRYLTGDFSVIGTSVLVAAAADVGSVEEALTAFLPGPSCATELPAEPYEIDGLGGGLLLGFEDCDGGNSEVLAAIDVPAFGAIALVAVQGPGPTSFTGVLLDAVFLSLTPV